MGERPGRELTGVEFTEMDEPSSLSRMLIVLGVVIVGVGALLLFADRVPLLGRLPGDVALRGDRWSFYFPLGTSILISIVLTLVLTLVGMARR